MAAQLRFSPLLRPQIFTRNHRLLPVNYPLLPTTSSLTRPLPLLPKSSIPSQTFTSSGNNNNNNSGDPPHRPSGGNGGDHNNDDHSHNDPHRSDLIGPIGLFVNGWRSRVSADPQFPFKVLMEEIVGVSSCVIGDMASRPNFGLNELDFVFCTLVVGSILNFVLMYLLAPTAGVSAATPFPSYMFEPGPFSLFSRIGTFAYKGVTFAAVGFAAGLLGTAISNGLIALRKKMDPGFESPNKPPPTVLNAVTWAIHMGLSSNVRYQTLNGVEFLMEKALPGAGFKASVVGLRCLNNVLGGMSFVMLARVTGSQKAKEELISDSGMAGAAESDDDAELRGDDSRINNAVTTFVKPLHELVEIVQKMILQSLGVEKHHDSLTNSTMHSLRVSEYGVPVNEDTKIGLDSHLDPNLLSVVCQHKIGGLEVQAMDSGDWIIVPPSPNSVAVIVGQSFQAWTNMRARAPRHRVRILEKGRRFSAIYSTRPMRNSIVKSPEELGDDDSGHPLLCKPFNYTEFVNYQYSEKAAGKSPEEAFNSFCLLEN